MYYKDEKTGYFYRVSPQPRQGSFLYDILKPFLGYFTAYYFFKLSSFAKEKTALSSQFLA